MGFEINTKMKFATVGEKFKKEYGIILALTLGGTSKPAGESRLSELSPKKNGLVTVSDNMTVKQLCEQISEQFGGEAAVWVLKGIYRGLPAPWLMEVPESTRLCDAQNVQGGKFVKAPDFIGKKEYLNEQQFQNLLGNLWLESFEKDMLKKTKWKPELEQKMRNWVRNLELFDIDAYIEELKLKQKKENRKLLFAALGAWFGIAVLLAILYFLQGT